MRLWYKLDGGTLMDISRRTFIKTSVAGGVAVSGLGFDLREAQAAVRQLKIRNAKEYRTVCPYCGRSDRLCSEIISVEAAHARDDCRRRHRAETPDKVSDYDVYWE